jgi:hypothetical protein
MLDGRTRSAAPSKPDDPSPDHRCSEPPHLCNVKIMRSDQFQLPESGDLAAVGYASRCPVSRDHDRALASRFVRGGCETGGAREDLRVGMLDWAGVARNRPRIRVTGPCSLVDTRRFFGFGPEMATRSSYSPGSLGGGEIPVPGRAPHRGWRISVELSILRMRASGFREVLRGVRSGGRYSCRVPGVFDRVSLRPALLSRVRSGSV